MQQKFIEKTVVVKLKDGSEQRFDQARKARIANDVYDLQFECWYDLLIVVDKYGNYTTFHLGDIDNYYTQVAEPDDHSPTPFERQEIDLVTGECKRLPKGITGIN